MLAPDIQQFFCFEMLGEMFDRLATSANVVGSTHAQLVKDSFITSAKIQTSHRCWLLGLASLVLSTIIVDQTT